LSIIFPVHQLIKSDLYNSNLEWHQIYSCGHYINDNYKKIQSPRN